MVTLVEETKLHYGHEIPFRFVFLILLFSPTFLFCFAPFFIAFKWLRIICCVFTSFLQNIQTNSDLQFKKQKESYQLIKPELL